MDRVNDIQYKIDQDTFELNSIGNNIIRFDEPFSISVILLPGHNIVQRINSSQIRFNIQQFDRNKLECWIVSEVGRIRIKTYEPEDWQMFLCANFLQVVGLIVATLVNNGEEDFLWVEPKDDKKIWILGVVWNENDKCWEGMLLARERMPTLFEDHLNYFLEGDHRDEDAKLLFSLLQDKESGLGLPNTFPFFSGSLMKLEKQLKFRQLTIKIHPNEMWFLVFPFDHFCRFRYGRFGFYYEEGVDKNIEWILKQKKSFIQNIYERLKMQNELSDARTFLKHSVIILNTYHHYNKEIKEKVAEGMSLVQEILGYLENIEFDTEEGSEVLSIKYYLNPSKCQIRQLLNDPDIGYLFAGFHVDSGGVWQLGQSSKDSALIEFPLDFLKKGDLQHIRLMRIFHCNSLLDPYSDPKSEGSIVVSLLNAGALRVEGSITKADFLNYLCSLLFLFCSGSGVQLILMGKCFEKCVDFFDIMKRVNLFLESCNWKTINISAV